MEQRALSTLLGLAGFLGFFHTLIGPDHYVPFIALARAGRWSLLRTLGVTLACGVGHVLSSVLLGSVGIALGLAVDRLEGWEGSRGSLAAWLVLSFGLIYAVWGLRRAARKHHHSHVHAHEDGTVHVHLHHHEGGHVHVHPATEHQPRLTPWILFTIFAFGPCEPLIPLLLFPASVKSVFAMIAVTSVYALATLMTMTAMVVLGHLGLRQINLSRWERYSHVAAGLAIAGCGLAIKLGL